MRQSQKLQTIGTLAAGIAHDFNNILAAIMGNIELALADTATEHPSRECLHQIGIAADRARSLVRQILAFSSHQPMERHSLPLGPLIQEAAKLLRATIPADVQIITSVEADVPQVLADSTEMHQVLVNLCTNAWHSFEGRQGRIEVKLQSLTLDAGAASRIVGLHPGRFACVSISDNGKGMDATVLDRIFDPFFTTKEPGKGVGLGLSVVHGIIKGCAGAIQVSSQPGQGTTFTLYLPSCESTPVASVPVAVAPGRGNNLSILHIDDDEPLLAVTTRMLQRLGFRVTAFSRPSDAVQAFRDNPGQFDLAITDMHMPKTTGLKVAIELQKIRPNFPILLSSGNVDDQLRQGALESGISAILSKPFSMAEFSETILRFSPIAHRS